MDNEAKQQKLIEQTLGVLDIVEQLQADQALLDALLKNQLEAATTNDSLPREPPTTNEMLPRQPIFEEAPPYTLTVCISHCNIQVALSVTTVLLTRIIWFLKLCFLLVVLIFFIFYQSFEPLRNIRNAFMGRKGRIFEASIDVLDELCFLWLSGY